MSIFRKSNQIVTELKSAVVDAEAVLRATANQAGGEIGELGSTIASRLAGAKDKLLVIEENLSRETSQAARRTDAYIHENPWQLALLAGGVGLLLGSLMLFRRH